MAWDLSNKVVRKYWVDWKIQIPKNNEFTSLFSTTKARLKHKHFRWSFLIQCFTTTVGMLFKLSENRMQRLADVINQYLFTIEHRKRIKCRKWDILLFYDKYGLILNLIAATYLLKVWTGLCLPLCSIPSSFNSVNVWELRRPAAGPLGEECCSILVWCRILGAQQSRIVFVVWPLCCVKCFQLVKGLDWGRPCNSHAVVIDEVCSLGLCSEIWKAFPKKDGSKCCSKMCLYLSALIVPFHTCKLPFL